jgi:hypothetical protein
VVVGASNRARNKKGLIHTTAISENASGGAQGNAATSACGCNR